MTPEELRELLTCQEGVKLEFKSEFKLVVLVKKNQQWTRFVEGQWHEFIKDILSLTNGNSPVTDEPGILVIGAADQLGADGTRELFDIGPLREITQKKLHDKVNEFTHPPIPDLQLEFVELDGKTLMVVQIPPTRYLHETTRDLITTDLLQIDPTDQSVKFQRGTSYLKGTAFVRRGDQVCTALDAEREAIKAEKQARNLTVSMAPIRLDPFLLQEDLKQQVIDTFVPPSGYARFQRALQAGRILWLTGPVGVGKRTCAIRLVVALASGQPVYVVRRSTPWDELARTGVECTAFVLPDALGDSRFDRDDLDADLASLDQLLARGNTVIVTSPDDVFEDAQRQSRLAEWLARHPHCRDKIERKAYTPTARQKIYREHISFASKSPEILTDSQYKLALSLLPDDLSSGDAPAAASRLQEIRSHFQQRLKDWLPLDIKHFVVSSLPSVNTLEELAEFLRLGTNIEQRAQDWLGNLHPDVQAFIITLAVWSGKPDAQIWEGHRQVVDRLRRLNPSLATLPLGLLRQRAAPHVTRHGPLDFTSSDSKRAVVAEATTSFREYFLEIMPLLQEWSIPALPAKPEPRSEEEDYKRAVDKIIAGSEDVRNAVADLAGELAKGGIEGVADLLRRWAQHNLARISKTVGISLARMLDEPRGIQPALDLLHTWARDQGEGEEVSRRAAAASAIWRLHAAEGGRPYRPTLLGLLYDLAGDPRDNVVASAAHSARMISRSASIGDLAPTMVRLADHPDKYPRQQTAFALNEIAARRTRGNAEGLVELLDAWSASSRRNIRWTAMCALLFGDRIPRVERHSLLARLLTDKPGRFLDVVIDSLDPRAYRAEEMRETAARSFVDLTEAPPKGIRPTMLQALAKWELQQPQPSLIDHVVSLLPRDYPERIRPFRSLLCRQMLLDQADKDPKRLLPLLTSLLALSAGSEATAVAGPPGRGDVRQITAGVFVDLLQARKKDQWVALFRDALAEQIIADGGPLLLLTFHDLLPDSACAAFAGLVREVLLRTFDGMAAADDTRFLGMLFGLLDPPLPTAAAPDSAGTEWSLDIRALTAEAVTDRIQDPLGSVAERLMHDLAAQIVVDRKPDVLFCLLDLIPETHASVLDDVLRQAIRQIFDLLVTLDVALIPSVFDQFQYDAAPAYAEQALAWLRTAAQPEPEGQREKWLSQLDEIDREVYARFDSGYSPGCLTGTLPTPLRDSACDLRDGIGPYDSMVAEGLVLDLRSQVLRHRLDMGNRHQDRATGDLLENWLMDIKDREVLWAALSRLEEGWGSPLIERLADICALCPNLLGQMKAAEAPATARTLLSCLTYELARRVTELVTRYTALAGSTQYDLGQVLERDLQDPRMRSLATGVLQTMSAPDFRDRQRIAEGLARSIMSSTELDLTIIRELSRDIPNVRSLLIQAYIMIQHEIGIRFPALLQISPVLLVDMLIELSGELRTRLARFVLSSSLLSPDRGSFIKTVAQGLVDHNPEDPLVPLNRLFRKEDTRHAELRKEILSEVRKLQARSHAYDLPGMHR